VALLDDILRVFGTNRVRLRWRVKETRDRWHRFWNRPARKAYEHKLCPQCGHPASREEKLCASCGAALPSVAVDRATRFVAWLVPEGLPLGTMLFLTASAALYFVTVKVSYDVFPDAGRRFAPNGWVLLRYGASVPLLERDAGEWWRLVTAIFLHGDVIHLGFNALGLWVAGRTVEERFGRARLIVTFLLTGVAGNLVSLAWRIHKGEEVVSSVGASGAVFGLIGCVVGHALRRRGTSGRELRARFVPWLLYGIIAGFAMSNIDNAAHLGGLACGLVVGSLLAERDRARGRLGEGIWIGLALTVLAAAGLSFWLVATHPLPLPPG